MLSKTEQGSTLKKISQLGARDTEIDQRLANSFCIGLQTLTMNYLWYICLGSVFKISRKEKKEYARFKNFCQFCRFALHYESVELVEGHFSYLSNKNSN